MKRQLVSAAVLALLVQAGGPNVLADSSSRPVTIVPSTALVSKGRNVQMFSAVFTIPPEQIGLPLSFKFSNGNYSGQKFAWVRVFLNHGRIDRPPASPTGRMILDERAFVRSNPVVLDMTGQFQAGTNTIIVQGAGVPGAAFNYELTAKPGRVSASGAAASGPLNISSIDPPEVPPGGQITIRGTGFDELGNNTKVMIYNRPVSVIRGSATEIVVKVPDGLAPHAYDVNLTVNGVKAKSSSVDVSGTPELSGTSMAGIVPGSTVDVYGNNFSKIPSKNVVTLTIPVFDNLKRTASVTAASKQSLTIMVPDFPELAQRINGNVNTPATLSISVNGVPAASTCFVTIGIRPMSN
jgi:hypothetical protein